jgi:hypothetical protein
MIGAVGAHVSPRGCNYHAYQTLSKLTHITTSRSERWLKWISVGDWVQGTRNRARVPSARTMYHQQTEVTLQLPPITSRQLPFNRSFPSSIPCHHARGPNRAPSIG